jgi:hypothetical protein
MTNRETDKPTNRQMSGRMRDRGDGQVKTSREQNRETDDEQTETDDQRAQRSETGL